MCIYAYANPMIIASSGKLWDTFTEQSVPNYIQPHYIASFDGYMNQESTIYEPCTKSSIETLREFPNFGAAEFPGEKGTVPLNFLHILVGRDAFPAVTDCWRSFEDSQNREITYINIW